MSEAAQNDRKPANSEPQKSKRSLFLVLTEKIAASGYEVQMLLISAAEVKPVQSADFRAL